MPDLLLQAGAVALGGAVGGVARVWLSVVLTARFGAVLPLGTLVVNVTGALALGWLAALALPGGGAVWLLLAVGALGSYTTVSTFAIETLGLWDDGRARAAAAYAALSLVLCLGGAALGLGLGGGW